MRKEKKKMKPLTEREISLLNMLKECVDRLPGTYFKPAAVFRTCCHTTIQQQHHTTCLVLRAKALIQEVEQQ